MSNDTQAYEWRPVKIEDDDYSSESSVIIPKKKKVTNRYEKYKTRSDLRFLVPRKELADIDRYPFIKDKNWYSPYWGIPDKYPRRVKVISKCQSQGRVGRLLYIRGWNSNIWGVEFRTKGRRGDIREFREKNLVAYITNEVTNKSTKYTRRITRSYRVEV